MLHLLTTANSLHIKSRRIDKKRGQTGAAMLETALVLLTLLAMITFIMDMGRLLLVQQFITERARVTARTAALNNWGASDAANFFCYNSTTAPGGDNTVPGYMGVLPSQVTYQTLGSSTSPDYRLQVVVSGIPMFTWIPYIAGQYTAPPITVTTAAQSLGATT